MISTLLNHTCRSCNQLPDSLNVRQAPGLRNIIESHCACPNGNGSAHILSLQRAVASGGSIARFGLARFVFRCLAETGAQDREFRFMMTRQVDDKIRSSRRTNCQLEVSYLTKPALNLWQQLPQESS